MSDTKRDRTNWLVDILSVVLISLAAVLTALCGYQSGSWVDRQTELYNRASSLGAQASTERATEATQEAGAASLFVQYIIALHQNDTELAHFLRGRFRADATSAIDAWSALHPLRNPSAPSTPFVMPIYTRAAFAKSEALQREADHTFSEAQEAGRTADKYLLVTVIFAGVSFLAGISTKMRYPNHLVVIGIGLVALAYGIIRLSQLRLLGL